MSGPVHYRAADGLNNTPVSLAAPLPVTQIGADGATAAASTNPAPEYAPGGLQAVSANFTRPADTTPYASGDLVANNTTAGSVVPLAFTSAVRAAGECFRIERVRLITSSTSLTNASFRVHIFRASPTVSVGDNGILNASSVLAVSDVQYLVGWADITVDRSGTANAVGRGVPATGPGMTASPTAGTTLYGLIEATAAYTPTSAEVFTVTLEGQWS